VIPPKSAIAKKWLIGILGSLTFAFRPDAVFCWWYMTTLQQAAERRGAGTYFTGRGGRIPRRGAATPLSQVADPQS